MVRIRTLIVDDEPLARRRLRSLLEAEPDFEPTGEAGDGQQAIVFVQTDARQHHYTMRRVHVTHRFEKSAFVQSTAISKGQQLTREEKEQGLLPKEPLREGERILLRGALELKAALLDKESQRPSEAKGDKDR